jgi:hypothetical protein
VARKFGKAIPLFVVIRIDDYLEASLENRITVTKVFPDSGTAELETNRLNELQRDKGCKYVWQATRGFGFSNDSISESGEA